MAGARRWNGGGTRWEAGLDRLETAGAHVPARIANVFVSTYLKALGIVRRMTTARRNSDFLNGVPEMLVLRLLAAEPQYGYQLVQTIKAATGNGLEFGEGCIYPILHRLEADGLLQSSRETVSGRKRIVYRVTPRGVTRLDESVNTWKQVVLAVQRALQGDAHVRPSLA